MQLALLGIALEEIGDLAAQQELAHQRRAFDRIGRQIVELVARARTREVEQVRVLEHGPGLRVHGDAQLGDEGGKDGTRQLDRAAYPSLRARADAELVLLVRRRAKLLHQRRHIDDAGVARDERAHFGDDLVGIADLLQRVDKEPVERREILEPAPQHREEIGPRLERQKRRERHRLVPVVQRLELLPTIEEVLVEVVREVADRDLVEMRRHGLGLLALRRGGDDGADLVAAGHRHLDVVLVEIALEAVGEDFDEVCLGEERELDRIFGIGRARRRCGGETRDKAGRIPCRPGD